MALKRLLWKKWLFIGQTEGETEQAYWNEKRKKHLAQEHNEGMVTGLEVLETSPPSLRVRVNAGRAIDTDGNDPEVESIQELDCASLVPGSGSVTVYVLLVYGEQEIEPYYVDEIGQNQNKYTKDIYTLAVGTTAPSDPSLELARILLVAGATQITDAADPDNPGNNEIDLRYRKKATAVVMNLDDLADVSVAEAAAFNNMSSPSGSNPVATIADVDSRVNPTKNEVQTARGSQSSLDARLDASLEESGALKSSVVGSSQVSAGSLDNSHLSSSADVDQTKIADTADASEDDTFSGAPASLQDDLNEIRTKIKSLKGTTGWKDTPTDTLEGVVGEVQAARGSMADVDDRLDTAHNEDGTHRTDVDLGKEVADARGSKSSLDGRMDVSLNEDGTLKSPQIVATLSRIGAEPALVFYPNDGAWQSQYKLHQFRGMMKNGPMYVDFSADHTSNPLVITFGAGIGPGGADSTNPSPSADTWYHVYLIAKADGTLALCYSPSSRLPWIHGPDLSHGNFTGFVYWKFIASLVNGQSGSWELVPLRKLGNHVEYEQAQLMYSSGGNHGWMRFAMGARIPETSMRGFFLLHAWANSGAVTVYMRPASGGTTEMQLQDTTPVSPKSQEYKLKADAGYAHPDTIDHDNCAGWCGTDNFQNVDLRSPAEGTREYQVLVLGYEEFTDFGSGTPEWKTGAL